MKFHGGPFDGRESNGTYAGAAVCFPSTEVHEGCLALHVRTDEYVVRDPDNADWFRAYTSMNWPTDE